jgi:hypothetical protein
MIEVYMLLENARKIFGHFCFNIRSYKYYKLKCNTNGNVCTYIYVTKHKGDEKLQPHTHACLRRHGSDDLHVNDGIMTKWE